MPSSQLSSEIPLVYYLSIAAHSSTYAAQFIYNIITAIERMLIAYRAVLNVNTCLKVIKRLTALTTKIKAIVIGTTLTYCS